MMRRVGSLPPQLAGVIIAAAGASTLSLEALFIRLMEIDPATILFMRGMLMAVGLFVVFLLMTRAEWRSEVRALGSAGLLTTVLFASDNSLFIYSITHTRVANTLVMLSLAPLIAAVMSRIFLHEHVPSRTWLAIGGAVAGVVIIFSGDLGTGGASGNWAGVGVAASIGGVLVVLRRNPTLNLIPAMALGSGVAGAIAAPWPRLVLLVRNYVFLVLGLGLVVSRSLSG